jgi:hypothetical protein
MIATKKYLNLMQEQRELWTFQKMILEFIRGR